MSKEFKNANGRYINFEALKEIDDYKEEDFLILGKYHNGRDYKISLRSFFETASELSLITGGSGSGDVVGPSSSTTNKIVLFNGTTGKLIKSSAYSETDLATLISDLTTAKTDIDSLESSITNYIPLTQKGAVNGVAPLNSSSKIDQTYLPSIALVDVYTVVDETAQLALSAQEGDVAIRTDTSTSYIHNGGTSGTMSDWSELLTPTDGVTSVGLSMPSIFSVSSSPVTSTGTLTVGLTNQSQNLVFASPNGSTGVPSFRALIIADVTDLQSALDNIKTYNRTGTTGGTANTYTLAATGYSAHASDVLFAIRVNNANTGASTININSLGTVALKKNSITGSLVDVEMNDLRTNHTYLVVYDGTYYVVLNPLTGPQNYETLAIAFSDLATAIAAATGAAYVRMPFGGKLMEVKVSLQTAQTSGSIFTVDINKNGTSVLTTAITVDNAEKTSTTATTAAVIDGAADTFTEDDEVSIDVDQVGDGTAKGGIVYLKFRKP